MNGRKELIELDFIAKVHALKRAKQREQGKSNSPAPSDPPAENVPAKSDDISLSLRARLQECREVFSWKKVAEKILVCSVQASVWLYLAGAFALWLLLQFGNERWWAFTVVLFGPRWLIMLPLIVLAPLAMMLRARLLVPLAVASVVVSFGVIGICVPWPWQGGDVESPHAVSLATCNVQGENRYWQQVRQLIELEQPDIVALQEASNGMLIAIPQPWHVFMKGRLVIASRYALLETAVCASEDPMMESAAVAVYALLDTPTGPLGVCNIQFPSLDRELDEFVGSSTLIGSPEYGIVLDQLDRQDRDSESVARWLEQLPQVDIILGGFNMPVESSEYRRRWSKYENAFSQVGRGLGFTEQAWAHRIRFGRRTDHILVGEDWKPLTCHVGFPIGADRLPLLARIEPVLE